MKTKQTHNSLPALRTSGPTPQRPGLLQRAAVNDAPVAAVPSVVQDVLRSPGRPLDAGTRAFMEPRFGHDFSRVRVHTDNRAAESARAVNALAYTVGRDVAFGPGQYAPQSRAGQRLLAHELAHVVQQDTGAVQSTLSPKSLTINAAGDPWERAADQAAESVTGESVTGESVTGESVTGESVTGESVTGESVTGESAAEGGPGRGQRVTALTSGSAGLSLQRQPESPGGEEPVSTHEQIQRAIHWSSRPNYQQVCLILNGLSMREMLKELDNVKSMGHLDPLAATAANATGVFRERLLAAIYAVQGGANAQSQAYTRLLPPDQQAQIRDYQAAKAVVPPLPPLIATPPAGPGVPSGSGPDPGRFSFTLPPPPESALAGLVEGPHIPKNEEPHPGLDAASSVTANAPARSDVRTYTLTVICRNCDAKTFGDEKSAKELDILHEPNFSVQISPDPSNKAVAQAAISALNLHLRKYGHEIELSLAAQIGVATPGSPAKPGGAARPTPSAGVQAQVELHITTHFSVTASSSISASPHNDNAPPDRGSIPLGTVRGSDVTWSPLNIGVLFHFD